MKLKNLITLLFLPYLTFGAEPSNKKAIDLFIETQQNLHILEGPDLSCITCQFPFSSESSQEVQGKVCDDLFAASCLAPDGKSKYQGRMKDLPQEMHKTIELARDKTAVMMGFKNFDHALKTKLKESGLELKEPVDAEAWKSLKKCDDSFNSQNNTEKLYKAIEQCAKEVEELKAISFYNMTEIVQLQEAEKKFDSFEAKSREQIIKLYAQDIPTFFNDHINQKCMTLKSNPSYYGAEKNQKIVKACQSISQLKRQAIDIFRSEGSASFQKLAEKFVRENFLPELVYSPNSQMKSSIPTGSLLEKTTIEKLKDKLQKSSNETNNICSNYSSAAKNTGNKIFQDFAEEVNKAKPTIDSIINSVYSDKKKLLVTQIFQETRSDIQAITAQFVKDPAKKTEIIKGYDSLRIFWMEKPGDSDYKKNEKGIPILGPSTTGTAVLSSFLENDVYTIFSDPTLSFFTTLNADYLPSISIGKYSNTERVNTMPMFLHLADKNPYAFLSVLAHEAGHKIGPQLAILNGYDLSSEYQELLVCFKDNKSIGLKKGQEDETIADYISAEVLARQISKLPIEKRQQALMSAMENFCLFDDDNERSLSIDCKDPHPELSLRLGGIFGANPNLRKVVGCQNESPKFKSCGLASLENVNTKPDSTKKGAP
jgi:hypothetical protein